MNVKGLIIGSVLSIFALALAFMLPSILASKADPSTIELFIIACVLLSIASPIIGAMD